MKVGKLIGVLTNAISKDTDVLKMDITVIDDIIKYREVGETDGTEQGAEIVKAISRPVSEPDNKI